MSERSSRADPELIEIPGRRATRFFVLPTSPEGT